jgi:hypothetical protein
MTLTAGFEARDDKPTGSPSGVDQLYGRETGLRTQVGEVALHRARLNAHQRSRVLDRPASCDVRGEDVHLARGRWSRECPAQVPVSHANRSAAAIHLARPSMGMR